MSVPTFLLNPEPHNRQKPVTLVSHGTKSSNLFTGAGIEAHHILVFNIQRFVIHDAVYRVNRVAGWVG